MQALDIFVETINSLGPHELREAVALANERRKDFARPASERAVWQQVHAMLFTYAILEGVEL